MKKNITVIGCGRWGSCIAWYLDRIGHHVTLYGRPSSKAMQQFLCERKNEYLSLPDPILLCTDLQQSLQTADLIVISIPVQNLSNLCEQLVGKIAPQTPIILCMKGIEISSLRRPTQIIRDQIAPTQAVAVWLGPGHVQEFYKGIPNCMVIDSPDSRLVEDIIPLLSGNIIRFYYGCDVIGNEIGAAAKNVIGIAAGLLDGLSLSSLKGALMSRGTREIARLIQAMGGREQSAFGLCHLGDYEATVFSPFSHNRKYGEAFVKGEPFDALAEGYYTVKALVALGEKYGVDLPICKTVYSILYDHSPAEQALQLLFMRAQRKEF